MNFPFHVLRVDSQETSRGLEKEKEKKAPSLPSVCTSKTRWEK